MDLLPTEIQLMCINYLELKEMCMVSETCSFMYNLTKEQLYQKKDRILQRNFIRND